ncbi:sigma-70 family RNA polymerase sigma factor [Kitasatospora sp. NPDC086791]|uniref:sigma-70 family RNA polymerase sigma factor n=1 Tax=Kitasatospora sp. NPDC086791 TaxID=3155178 RepID=UPI003416037A
MQATIDRPPGGSAAAKTSGAPGAPAASGVPAAPGASGAARTGGAARAGGAEDTGDGRAGLRALTARTAHGDERAFEDLYGAPAAPVLALVLRVLRDRAQAEEVAQEVFWQVWREAPRYRPERGEVLPWVLTLAHRRAVDRVRSARAAADRDRAAARRDHTPDFDEVADRVEDALERDRVRRALAVLSEAQRECLLLVYFGGCAQAQAAARIGAPLGTVKTRIHDALRHLRDHLGDTPPPPPTTPRRYARPPGAPPRPAVGSRP